MIAVISMSERVYTNTTYTSPLVMLSSVRPVTSRSSILVRMDITSLNVGSVVTFSYTFGRNGHPDIHSDIPMESAGRYEIGFSRSDFDNVSTVQASIQVVGTATIAITIYLVDGGEDVQEWQ